MPYMGRTEGQFIEWFYSHLIVMQIGFMTVIGK